MSSSESGTGGLKEVIASIEGRGVYSRLKYESGVHRVQRVPATEASGRIHTSTATVAVLPEAEEVDIQINEKDLRVDTFCSSGPGGQSVNTTYSAVRLTHIPDRRRRLAAGREIADQEPREGDEGAARASLRDGDAETAGSDRQGAARPGRHRRTIGEDPDLQLPAEPHHRSPHQLHHPSAARRPRGRSRRDPRSGHRVLQRREAQGSDRRSVDAPRRHLRRRARASSRQASPRPKRRSTSICTPARSWGGTGRACSSSSRGRCPNALEPTFSEWIAPARTPRAVGLHRRRPRVLGARLRRHARRADPAAGNRIDRRRERWTFCRRQRHLPPARAWRTSAPAAAASRLRWRVELPELPDRRDRRLGRRARRSPAANAGASRRGATASSSSHTSYLDGVDGRIRPHHGESALRQGRRQAGAGAATCGTSRTSRCSAAPRGCATSPACSRLPRRS